MTKEERRTLMSNLFSDFESALAEDRDEEAKRIAGEITKVRNLDPLAILLKENDNYVLWRVHILEDDCDSPDGYSYDVYYCGYPNMTEKEKDGFYNCWYEVISSKEAIEVTYMIPEWMECAILDYETGCDLEDYEHSYAEIEKIYNEAPKKKWRDIE